MPDDLEEAFQPFWIEARSPISRARSGAIYFTLKDESCQVRARCSALHKPRAPEDGMQMLAHAKVGLYPGTRRVQLVVQYMEEAGAARFDVRSMH